MNAIGVLAVVAAGLVSVVVVFQLALAAGKPWAAGGVIAQDLVPDGALTVGDWVLVEPFLLKMRQFCSAAAATTDG